MKNNLDFYRHMVDSHDNWKFKTLRRVYAKTFGGDGWAGEGRFWALNNMIAKSEDCSIDITSDKRLAEIAAGLDLSLSELKQFLEILKTDCYLLSIEGNQMTTEMIQENLDYIKKNREQKRVAKQNERARKKESQTTGEATMPMSHATNEMSHATNEMSPATNSDVAGDSDTTHLHVDSDRDATNSDVAGDSDENSGKTGGVISNIYDTNACADENVAGDNTDVAGDKAQTFKTYNSTRVEQSLHTQQSLQQEESDILPKKNFSANQKKINDLRSLEESIRTASQLPLGEQPIPPAPLPKKAAARKKTNPNPETSCTRRFKESYMSWYSTVEGKQPKFGPGEGVAIKQLATYLKGQAEASDEQERENLAVQEFSSILMQLPSVQDGFLKKIRDIKVINSKINDIIPAIKNRKSPSKNGTHQQTLANGYKPRNSELGVFSLIDDIKAEPLYKFNAS